MEDRWILRRLAPIALAGALLAAAACGGGGGDDNPGPTQLSIVSTPELDGTVSAGGAAPASRSDLQPGVGDGIFVVGSGTPQFQSFYSFDLSFVPAGGTVTSAVLSLFLRQTAGDPDGMMVLIRLDHVRFDDVFPATPLTPQVLEANFDQIDPTDVVGRRLIDVTAQVQADLDAGRTRSQFRLRGAITTNNDAVADVAFFTDGEDSQGSGELPFLDLVVEP